VMREAAHLTAKTEGNGAAADYLAEAAMALWGAGFERGAWTAATLGLGYIGERRDLTWVRLMLNDVVRREAEDPSNPGVVLDTPERRAMDEITHRLPLPSSEEIFLAIHGFRAGKSRKDILHRLSDPFWLMCGAGEYRRCLQLWDELIRQREREGRIVGAIGSAAQLARCHNALGAFADAQTAYDRGAALAARLTGPLVQTMALPAATYVQIVLAGARYEMQIAADEGWEDYLREAVTLFGQQPSSETHSMFAGAWAMGARISARLGKADEALLLLGALLAPLERAPAWALNYPLLACNAANTLWLLQRTDHIETIEQNLREKVLAPDFRFPMEDTRLSVAHLSALQGRYDEAREWFGTARTVLDGQGARPLRAIVDYDEALMYARRGAPGDPERARPLLDAALRQFCTLGMPGWIRRAEALLKSGAAGGQSGGALR